MELVCEQTQEQLDASVAPNVRGGDDGLGKAARKRARCDDSSDTASSTAGSATSGETAAKAQEQTPAPSQPVAAKTRTYINCLPADHPKCRDVGGRWDKFAGRAYVRAGCHLAPFAAWLPNNPELRCTGHQAPAATLKLRSGKTISFCSQRFCCDFLQTEDGNSDWNRVIAGYRPAPGTAGLTSYCWSYLQSGECANVALGHCCCLKHASCRV